MFQCVFVGDRCVLAFDLRGPLKFPERCPSVRWTVSGVSRYPLLTITRPVLISSCGTVTYWRQKQVAGEWLFVWICGFVSGIMDSSSCSHVLLWPVKDAISICQLHAENWHALFDFLSLSLQTYISLWLELNSIWVRALPGPMHLGLCSAWSEGGAVLPPNFTQTSTRVEKGDCRLEL
jgi:hypothetical protein